MGFFSHLIFELHDAGFEVVEALRTVEAFHRVGESVIAVGEILVAGFFAGFIDCGVEIFERGAFFELDVDVGKRCLAKEGRRR